LIGCARSRVLYRGCYEHIGVIQRGVLWPMLSQAGPWSPLSARARVLLGPRMPVAQGAAGFGHVDEDHRYLPMGSSSSKWALKFR